MNAGRGLLRQCKNTDGQLAQAVNVCALGATCQLVDAVVVSYDVRSRHGKGEETVDRPFTA